MIVEGEDQVVEEEILDDQSEEIVENTNDPNLEEDPETSNQDDTEDDEEDRIVSIGEPEEEPETEDSEEEQQETSGWVKTVRKSNRRLESENKKLKKQLEERNKPVEKTVELGNKPTSASCGYDDAKYEQEILAYDARRRKVEGQATERQHVVEEQNKQWHTRQDKYVSLRKEHNFKDFPEAEELVSDAFNQTQQGIIVSGAEDAALLVYALGKNPKKLEEMAKINDPVAFAFKVAKLEAQLKVTNRKAPRPEKRIQGNKDSGGSTKTDATLQKLRNKADKTGDRSEVAAYMRKMRKE